VDSSGRFAYVADRSPRIVRVIDLLDFKVVANIDLTGHPFALAIHPTGRFFRLCDDASHQCQRGYGRRADAVGHRYGNQCARRGRQHPRKYSMGCSVNPAGTLVYVVTVSGVLVISNCDQYNRW